MRKLSILSLVFLSMLITGAAHGKVCFLADPECQGGLAEKKTLEFEVIKCKKDSINGKDKCIAKDYRVVCKDSTGDYYEEIGCKNEYVDIRENGYGCKDLQCDHCCLPKDIECPGGYELYTHREFLEDGPDECKCGYKPYDTTAGKWLPGGVDGQDAYCAPKIECLACCDISKGQYDTDAACKASKAHSTCTKNGNCYEVSGCETGYTMSNNSCVKNSGGGSGGNPCLGKSGGYVCSQNDKWYSSESGCSSACGGSTKCLKCGSGNMVEFDGEIYDNEAVGSVTTRNPDCPANCDFFYQTHRGCVTQCEGGQGPVVYDCIACILTTGGSSLTK